MDNQNNIKHKSWYRIYRYFFSNLKSTGEGSILESYIDFLENLIDSGHGIVLEEIDESEIYIETKEDLRNALSGFFKD